MEAVLANGTISDEYRGSAVIWSAALGDLGIVKALLEHGSINEACRQYALFVAEKKFPDIMFVLQGDSPDQALIKEIQKPYYSIDYALINYILSQHVTSKEARSEAVRLALAKETVNRFKGDLTMVQALLAHGPIPAVYRFQAIENADTNHHASIVIALGGNPNVGLLDVHIGDRDEKTKNSVINFYTHQGPITTVEINEAYNNFVTYLQTPGATLKETESKQKAFHALVVEKIDGESFGPFIQAGSNFTINGHPVDTKEFIARLWSFVNHLADEKDKSVAISGLIGALEDSVLANNHRVCNGGKMQRLIVAVLQGRMPGINVESHEISTEEVSNEKAGQMFYLKEEIQGITKLTTLLNEASKFCKDNPLVNKKSFLEHLTENRALLVAEQDVADSDLGAFIDELCK